MTEIDKQKFDAALERTYWAVRLDLNKKWDTVSKLEQSQMYEQKGYEYLPREGITIKIRILVTRL